jgi:serine/threonine-protein kinase
MPTLESPEPSPNSRFNELAERVLTDRERGRPVDLNRLIADFPEFADEIRDLVQDGSEMDELIRRLARARPDPPPMIGCRVGETELCAFLGSGGQGEVYLGWQPERKRMVAVKLLHAHLSANGRQRARFVVESEAAGRLIHPNVIQVLGTGEHDGRLYQIMAWIPGGTLAAACKRFVTDPVNAARVVAAVARAVQHAHDRGVLHRDLKPANVLLDRDGDPHVTDFGLAKLIDAPSAGTSEGSLVGTLRYMAPELLAGGGPATVRTDVYGLGTILYELLTGRPCFTDDPAVLARRIRDDDPDPPNSVNPRVDRTVSEICLRCLEKQPARRFESSGALADALDVYARSGSPAFAPLFELMRTVALLARVVSAVEDLADYRRVVRALWAQGAVVAVTNAGVAGLLALAADEFWVWLILFASYVPLLVTLARGRTVRQVVNNPRQRLVWAVWVGHMAAAAGVFASARLQPHQDFTQVIAAGYAACAGLNALAFFALGAAYTGRLIPLGLGWVGVSVLVGLTPAEAGIWYGAYMASCCGAVAAHLAYR